MKATLTIEVPDDWKKGDGRRCPFRDWMACTVNDWKMCNADNCPLEIQDEPMKPIEGHRNFFGSEQKMFQCPKCKKELVAYSFVGGVHWCHSCGQAIDWESVES